MKNQSREEKTSLALKPTISSLWPLCQRPNEIANFCCKKWRGVLFYSEIMAILLLPVLWHPTWYRQTTKIHAIDSQNSISDGGPRTKNSIIIIYLLSFGVVTFNYEAARRANHWLRTDMEKYSFFLLAKAMHDSLTHETRQQQQQQEQQRKYFKLIRNGQFECFSLSLVCCCCTRDTPKPLNVLLWCHSFNISRWFQSFYYIELLHCAVKRILSCLLSYFY